MSDLSMANPDRRPAKARGRKRDADRTDAILTATAELLVEVGFDRLRISDVAKRAGSGTGAIYRRWPKKEALLAEAIRAMPAVDAPATDDPIADFRMLVARRCRSTAEKPDLVPGLISAMRADEGIERAVKDGFSLEHMREVIGRIVGPDHPHLGVLTELVDALNVFRAAFIPETVEPEAMTEELVSFVQSLAQPSHSKSE